MGRSKTVGTRHNNSSDREDSNHNELIPEPPIIAWEWIGLGAIDGLPASTLTKSWIRDNNISEEKIRNTGLYRPVYEEDINNATRTKSTTENSIGERDGEREGGDVLHESESGGRDAE